MNRAKASKRLWLAVWFVSGGLGAAAPASALQDPTRPPGFDDRPAKAIPKTDLALQSILVGAERRVAVINGEPRAEGQAFDGVKVRRIHRDRVEVMERGRVRTLYLDKLPQVRRTQ